MDRSELSKEHGRRLTMTFRLTEDLDIKLAAVALLRGTTKSGILAKCAAEQVSVEQERDQNAFAKALKEVTNMRVTPARRKAPQSSVQRHSRASNAEKNRGQNIE